MQGQLPKVLLPMIGVPGGGMGGRHLYCTSAHSVVGGALFDRPCMVFHRKCVLCLWSQ